MNIPELQKANGPNRANFWDNVRKTKTCWLWTGSVRRSHNKYIGKFGPHNAHRLSYEFHFGKIPNGHDICHICHHSLCVRPDHMYLAGTIPLRLKCNRGKNKVNFWDNANKTRTCWVWTGCVKNQRSKLKYGCFHRSVAAHRIAYEERHGKIPKGMCVLHKCDNSLCVNPDHLFLGTAADNVRDMCNKGRNSIMKGEDHPGAKINNKTARAIRRLRASGMLLKDIAARLGISRSIAKDVSVGRSWKHIS